MHATVLVVRNFLDDLTLWGWAERPAGQLLFAADGTPLRVVPTSCATPSAPPWSTPG